MLNFKPYGVVVLRSRVAVLATALHGVLDHVCKHAGDVLVRCFVKHLFVAPRSPHQPRGPQQTQMVADKRRRGGNGLGDIADGDRFGQAGQQHAQAGGVAQQAIGLGDDGDLGVAGKGHVLSLRGLLAQEVGRFDTARQPRLAIAGGLQLEEFCITAPQRQQLLM